MTAGTTALLTMPGNGTEVTKKGNGIVVSTCTYPKDYRVVPIKDQIISLGKLFSLDTENALKMISSLPPLYNGAQGWFAIPNMLTIQNNSSLSKAACTERIIEDAFNNLNTIFSQESKICDNLCTHTFFKKEKTKLALGQIFTTQKRSPIAIIGCQWGASHRGKSGEQISEDIYFKKNEFELDILSLVSILCTNANRLTSTNTNVLGVLCSGDYFEDNDDGTLYHPAFYNQNGIITITKQHLNEPDKRLGGVTGFLS